MSRLLRSLRPASAFTLIELLVVILVLAILVAVAVPSFLGHLEKAQDSEAKQYLTVAYKAAKASAVREQNQGDYVVLPDFDHADLAAAIDASEPYFETGFFGDQGQNEEPKRIVVDDQDGANSIKTDASRLVIHNQSKSGNYCTLDTGVSAQAVNTYCNESGLPAPSAVSGSGPTVSGTAQEDFVLTASAGSWDGAPTSYTYQWQSSHSPWVDIDVSDGGYLVESPLTSHSYTVKAADVGGLLRVCVVAHGPGGDSAPVCSDAVPTSGTVLPAPPVVNSLPAVTGTAQVGSQLTVSQGSWSKTPTSYAYEWLRCQDATDPADDCTAIGSPDATDDDDYTPVAADEGLYLRAQVTASNTGGSGYATSQATTSVLPDEPANTAAPQLSGSGQPDQPLTTTQGSWTNSPTSYSYQWQSSSDTVTWTAIAGAPDASSYSPSSALSGQYVRARVRASNAGGFGDAFSNARLISQTYSATVLAKSPLAYWRLGETSGAYADSSGNNRYLTHQSSFTRGVTGAISGDDGAVSQLGGSPGLPANGTLNLANQSFTLEAWAKRNALSSGSQRIIFGQGPAAQNTGLHVGFQSNDAFMCAFYANDLVTSATYTDTANWHHYVCTYDAATNARKIYVDGVLAASDTAPADYQGTGTFYLGQAYSTGGGYSNARLDEVAVYGSVLNQTQIQAHYSLGRSGTEAPYLLSAPTVSGTPYPGDTLTGTQGSWGGTVASYAYQWLRCDSSGTTCATIAGATGLNYTVQTSDFGYYLKLQVTASNAYDATTAQSSLTTGVLSYEDAVLSLSPLAYWRLGEATGATTAADSSGNGRTASYNASWTRGVAGAIAGSSNTAASQNGSGALSIGGPAFNLANQSFSVEVWAKRASVNTHNYIFGQGNFSDNTGLHVGFRNSNTFTCAFYANDLDTPGTYTSTTAWNHFVCTYDATTNAHRIYVNGALVASRTAPADYQGSGTFTLGGGYSNGNSPFNGTLDEAAVYGTALTAAQVQDHYDRGT